MIVCASSMKRMMLSFSLTSSMMPLDPLLEHSSQHSCRDQTAHLKLDDMRIAEACRDLLRLQFDQPCEAFDDSGLADAGLATPSIGELDRSRCERISIIDGSLFRGRWSAGGSCPDGRVYSSRRQSVGGTTAARISPLSFPLPFRVS